MNARGNILNSEGASQPMGSARVSRAQPGVPPGWAGRESGSALMVVMWALLVLSAAIFAWVEIIRQQHVMHGQATAEMEARAMAHSGVTVALNPRITKTSPQLENMLEEDYGYRVRMISEGGKLNINWLVAGEDPRKIGMLKQWLEMHGLSFQEREKFVDCLLDYVDQDNLHRMN